MKSIGVDIGGTKIAVGLVDNDRILQKYILPNTFFADPGSMIRTISEYIDKLHQQSNSIIEGIGVGCPGWVVDGIVYDAVNLGIQKFHLVEELTNYCGIKTLADNDARTALLCELKYGALQNSTNGAMITFGTGVGGALMFNHQLYRGSFGCAGEIGHLTLNGIDGTCPCGKIGCFEQASSVHALIALARQYGFDIEDGLAVCELAESGDRTAQTVLDHYTDSAARGVIELVMLLDLDTVAVGGGISRQWNRFTYPLQEKVNRYLPKCSVVPAEFTNDAGIIGAAVLCDEEV